MNEYKCTTEQFEKVKDLDSRVFVEIPQRQIVEHIAYRRWLVEEVETRWMTEFNKGNESFLPNYTFTDESGVGGYFGGIYIEHSKLHRFDGTEDAISEDDYRAKRGLLIRDHYSENDVVKVQLIADNLAEFLKQQRIEFSRKDFKKKI